MPTGDFIRLRLEIEVDGKHIGMVSSYYLNKSFEPADWENIDTSKNAIENDVIRAIGIEIFEKDFWCKGIGSKSIIAFMDYYRNIGENKFLLETWSGNHRMQACAKKLGFIEVHREKNKYIVDGVGYDAIVLEKQF